MTWYHPGFVYKKSLMFPHANVSGGADLLDFPLLVSVNSPDLITSAYGGLMQTSHGYDLLFTDATERRELAYEIENYNPLTGSLLCWVRVPVLSASVDTVLYLYFGNPTITASLANPVGVWDPYFSSVWHMGDGAHLSAFDSVTNQGGYPATAVPSPGQVNGAAFFTGGNTIQAGNTGSIDFTTGDTITISAWAKQWPGKQSSAWQALVSHGTGTLRDYEFALDGPDGALLFRYRDSGNTTWQSYESTLLTLGPPFLSLNLATWHYYCLTLTYGTATSIQLYADSINVNSDWFSGTGHATPAATYDRLAIGSSTDGDDGFHGWIDEVRISKGIARSAGWIATEYANQSAPSTSLIVGTTITASGNIDSTLIVASGVTTGTTTPTLLNTNAQGVQLTLTVLALDADNSLQVTLSGQDETGVQSYTLGSFGASALGPNVMTLYPGLAPASLVIADRLPRTWQVTVTPTTSEPASYTLGASLLI